MQKIFAKFWQKTQFFHLEDKDNDRETAVVEYLYKNLKINLIIFLTGPMNSGKTSVLIQLARKIPKRVITFTHINDRKRNGGEDNLVAWGKQKLKYQALPYQSLQDILDLLEKDKLFDKLILIEEVQFADNLKISQRLWVRFVSQINQRHCRVVFAGLNTDFKRNVWRNSSLLLKNVDQIIHLDTICRVKNCRESAFLNQLNIDGLPASLQTDIVQIAKVGEKKLQFMPVCRMHHQLG